MDYLPDWKKKICKECRYFEICPIDQDCKAIEILEWTYEDICDDNTEIGDW